MGNLPSGFRESIDIGRYDLAQFGFDHWAKNNSTERNISLMSTDTGLILCVASCLVGRLREIAEEIPTMEKRYFDSSFYSMAYLVATNNYVNIKNLQRPKYPDLNIIYSSTGDRRVWAIHSSMNIDGGKTSVPLLIRAAQSRKKQELDVMSIISDSNRH